MPKEEIISPSILVKRPGEAQEGRPSLDTVCACINFFVEDSVEDSKRR